MALVHAARGIAALVVGETETYQGVAEAIPFFDPKKTQTDA
ncbi:MAG: hypothetical protein P8L46_06215 [Acidimicrobiales bacterium]|nr:hypothetical protein [Acidimicrobiales bacterium]MDG2217625.1 hypothetical protein [Acidimicrobiales bacterium]